MMARCTNREIGKRLHAWELGLLSGEEQRLVEQHLIECAECFAEAERFETIARALRRDEALKSAAASAAEEALREPVRSLKAWRAWPQALVPAAVFVLIVGLLVLTDWQFEIRPSHPLMASENRVAVFPFEELGASDETSRVGEVIGNLVATSLSQCPPLRVVSSQYIFDLSREESGRSDGSRAPNPKRIAQRAAAAYYVEGAVVQVQPSMAVSVQVVEASTGAVLGSTRYAAASEESIFSAADSLAAAVSRILLKTEEPSVRGPRVSVQEITTFSRDAYEEYTLGVAYMRRAYYDEAEAHFRRAIAYDSLFAMAFYYLSTVATDGSRREYLDRAVALVGRAGEREQYYILSRAAMTGGNRDEGLAILREFVRRYPDEKEPLYLLGRSEYGMRRWDEAHAHLSAALALDSANKEVLNLLAYTYDRRGDFEGALCAVEHYIRVAPGEANPYDTKGELWARNGRLGEAIQSYRVALRIKPDFHQSLSYLGLMYVFSRDFTRAESCFTALQSAGTTAWESAARTFRCYIPLNEGRFEAGLSELEAGLKEDSVAGYLIGAGGKAFVKATVFAALGRIGAAQGELDRSSRLAPELEHLEAYRRDAFRVHLYVRAGQLAEARKEAEDLCARADSAGVTGSACWCAMGSVLEAMGHVDSGIVLFRRAADSSDAFYDELCLGLAYLGGDRPSEAVVTLERLASEYASPRLLWSAEHMRLPYYLGCAYEASGDDRQAAAQFKQFLDAWALTGEAIPECAEARDRLRRLGGGQ